MARTTGGRSAAAGIGLGEQELRQWRVRRRRRPCVARASASARRHATRCICARASSPLRLATTACGETEADRGVDPARDGEARPGAPRRGSEVPDIEEGGGQEQALVPPRDRAPSRAPRPRGEGAICSRQASAPVEHLRAGRRTRRTILRSSPDSRATPAPVRVSRSTTAEISAGRGQRSAIASESTRVEPDRSGCRDGLLRPGRMPPHHARPTAATVDCMASASAILSAVGHRARRARPRARGLAIRRGSSW